MRFSSRLLALVICLLMIVTVLPVGVFAEETVLEETVLEETVLEETVLEETVLEETVLEETETSPEEHVKFCGVQTGNDGTSIRIVFGVNDLGYSKAGVKVERLMGGDGWVVGDMELTKTRVVFTSILEEGNPVSAEEYGVEYFAVVAITEISTEGAIRLTPYVKVVDGEEIYGETRVYAVDFVGEELVLTMSTESYTQDFTEFKPGAAGRDTWEQQSEPSSDNSWGGEGARSMSHDAENGWAKWAGGPMAQYRSATKPESRVSDSASALTFKDGTPMPYWTQSERLKFTKTIPCDLKDYLGKTIVITAMIRVDEIAKYSQDKEGPGVTVYVDSKGNAVAEGTEGATAKTYYGYKEDIMTGVDAKVTVTFGFYDEFDTSPISGASTTYVLKADSEWVEISSSLEVTQKLLDARKPVKDANGVYHPSAVRPSISAGSNSAYIKTAYFDYITCTVVPTDHDKCTDFVDVSVEATCTVDGYTGKACAVCNKLDEDTLVVTRAEGHKSNEVTDPCMQDSYCTVCGEMLHKAEGHTNVEYLAPTISSDGYIKGTCGKCGEVFDELLPRGLYEDFENMIVNSNITSDIWNKNSAFAVDEVEVSLGANVWETQSTVATEENGNKYWLKKTGTGGSGVSIFDKTEKKIFTDSVIEISFDYMRVSGSSNCSIIGYHVAGQSSSTDQRLLCLWGTNIHSGANGGPDLIGAKANVWNKIRAVMDTTTYDHKIWINDKLVLVTDYANSEVHYCDSAGSWHTIATSTYTNKQCHKTDKTKDFSDIYLFHSNTSVVWGLDNFKIAVLNSMPTDTYPAAE